MQEVIQNFKKQLKSERGVFGPFMITSDAAFVEAAGYAGYDFVILDMEHGPSSYENMQNLIRGAQISGVMPIIRVSRGLEIWIDRALDIGAGGVMVPQVDNAKQAQEAVAAAKFSPKGSRGVCRYVRAARYSDKELQSYFNDSNETVVIIQAEGQTAFNNLDEILAVEGIDMLFIGPYDLSASLGLIGQIDHPKVHECMKDIITRAGEKGISVGTFMDSPDKIPFWRNLGVKFFSYACDTGIFYRGAKQDVDQFLKEAE